MSRRYKIRAAEGSDKRWEQYHFLSTWSSSVHYMMAVPAMLNYQGTKERLSEEALKDHLSHILQHTL